MDIFVDIAVLVMFELSETDSSKWFLALRKYFRASFGV